MERSGEFQCRLGENSLQSFTLWRPGICRSFWREGFYREEGEVSRLQKANGDHCLLLLLHLCPPLRLCCLQEGSFWQSSAHLSGLLCTCSHLSFVLQQCSDIPVGMSLEHPLPAHFTSEGRTKYFPLLSALVEPFQFSF